MPRRPFIHLMSVQATIRTHYDDKRLRADLNNALLNRQLESYVADGRLFGRVCLLKLCPADAIDL